MLLEAGVLGVGAGQWIGWVIACVSAIWIFWKEVIQKRINAQVERDAAVTTADIDRLKHKDLTESAALKDILTAYTKLNDNVFSLFEEYLTNVRKDVSAIKADVRIIKNFQDMFDRNFDEVLDRLKQLEAHHGIRKTNDHE